MSSNTKKTPDKIIKRIRNLKATTEMTYIEIAKEVGVTHSTVARYLNEGIPKRERNPQETKYIDELIKLNNKNKSVRQLLSNIEVGEKIEIVKTVRKKDYITVVRVEQICKDGFHAKSDEGKRLSIFHYQLLMEEMKIRKVS